MVITPEAVGAPAGSEAPWVLLLINDDRERAAVRQAWEQAGFAVEVVDSAKAALECLKVMTPSLVVIEDRLYRPVPR